MGKLSRAGKYEFDEREGAILLKKRFHFIEKLPKQNKAEEFKRFFLHGNRPGVTFGYIGNRSTHVVGMPEGDDGNILVIGGNGSGKSRGIAMPTLKQWGGTICATDLKGELSDFYAALYQTGAVTRPYIIFEPTQAEGPSYDPFWWLLKDDTSNLINNLWEIVLAIVPPAPGENQPFWVESEQALFAASLLYFFKLGLSFSEAICEIMSTSTSSLCEKLSTSPEVQVRMLLGNPAQLKSDVLAAIDRGLRNKLMLFSSDPYISHAFRGTREGAKCFTWEDLEHSNIFLRVPADKVEQWGGAINLMLTQLLHYLERRPEKHSLEAEQIPQVLLLLDEFARFGKLDMLPAAMATLRSKKVNICLLAQSIAQIDAIYGTAERRIILDNCQFQAILRANDPDTQDALCKLIGTRIQRHHSVSQQRDSSMKGITGYSINISEVRDWMVCPHELATLEDVLLLTPHGFLRLQKFGSGNSGLQSSQLTNVSSKTSIHNKGARILMIEERIKNSNVRAQSAEKQQRVLQKQASDRQRQQENHLKYLLGGLVLKYFPKLCEIDSSETQEEMQERLQPVETILAVLAARPDLVQRLQDEADTMTHSEPTATDV